ncbi:MAG: cyclomaltodextrinase N-terminal domain-containing protein [Bacteroidia bacterium]|nr:cyclomaltodextrinase N-terminal domain-containing protein [Bacteroidia bacterium]MCF8426923.1 cyclomaltodextrinase N-terminal domain-containing protein [Bacteroidia bacterium]MCF8447722.1 cyclomaltodextrinase N-terminal domain-containing protein [Bacteroidia bacterium]
MKQINKIFFLFLLSLSSLFAFAQKPEIKRIDPSYWWHNLETRELQLLVYGINVASYEAKVKSPGIVISKVEKLANPNYLVLYLDLQNYHEKEFLIDFVFEGKAKTVKYELKTLQKLPHQMEAADFVYLVFPDRFSSGTPKNDASKTMRESTCSRDTLGARHGGDLLGIINHLDYMQDLGITTLWLNPTLVNDQPAYSYHGYALTDHYLTDPRLGTNEDYQKLGYELHKRGMKLMMDLVPNHIGSKHWMMLDMPDPSFVNQWPEFTRTNYRATTQFDPHASEYDKKRMVDGWFDTQMPDVNERTPWVAKYLMQSYLWWINYAGIDAYRIDTYSYNDYEFMDKCMAYIQKEYLDFYSTGEIWEQGGVLNMAYFTEKNNYKKSPSSSHLTSAKDFQMYWSVLDALNNKPEWDKGLAKIYFTLTHDGLYNNPNLNLTFLDNHDLNRFYTDIKEDFAKWKIGMGILLTMRGVPSIYYGTEILLTNPLPRTNDGQIRQDFPGGWPTDTINKFTKEGRTIQENEAYDYIKKFARLRRDNEAFNTGKLMQFTPEGNTYVYFRYTPTECFMIAINRGEKEEVIDTKRMQERLNGYVSGKDHVSDEELSDLKKIKLAPNSIRIIELGK